MNRILLVARRDYRQVVGTRGFKITLVIVPLMLALSLIASTLLRPPPTTAYIIADGSGVFASAVEHRLNLDYQAQVLRALSAYAHRWNAPDPATGWSSDQDVEAFIRSGGAAAALRRMALPATVPAFKSPVPSYVRVPVPGGVPTQSGAAAFGRAIAPYLQSDIETPLGRCPLAAAVYVPAHGSARVWTNGRANDGLVETIQDERSHLARLAMLRANGIDPAAADRIENAGEPMPVMVPPRGGGRAQMTVRSIVPLALVYLLLVSALITGGMMLQGVIEERSNRLFEAVLACVEPRELLFGKLIGLGAVGLTILVVWVGCALAAAFSIDGVAADFLGPSLAALDQPWMIPVMIFYFVCGYLILAMVYLAIGSLSNSMQDAQAFLMPVTMGVLIPVMLMVGSAVQNPGGWLPQVMSWIPVYTPFAMLARLGNGVTLLEVGGTGVLLIAFLALEVVLLGRVFEASILNTGQPPKAGAFFKLMLRPD